MATTDVNSYEVAIGIELEQSSSAQESFAANWADLMSSLEVLPLTRRAVQTAIRRQAGLFRAGRPSALADLFIAAVARVSGCTVIVTRDRDDFERIGLLPTETH